MDTGAASLESCPTGAEQRCGFDTGRNSEDCHYIRNHYPLDHADVVLAIYDMNADKQSGTGYIVHYAQAQGLPLIASDPDDFRSSFFGTETQKKYFNFFQKSCDQSE